MPVDIREGDYVQWSSYAPECPTAIGIVLACDPLSGPTGSLVVKWLRKPHTFGWRNVMEEEKLPYSWVTLLSREVAVLHLLEPYTENTNADDDDY